MEKANKSPGSSLGERLKTNRVFKIGEILLLFIAAFSLILLLDPLVGDNLVFKQAVLWLANVVMLIYIWLGLKLRGEDWKDIGLSFNNFSWKGGGKTILLSLLVFMIAMLGFLIGSVIMANITGIPETNTEGYDYLRDNIWMLVLTLVGVYIVSSFGEEVIYRGFLINRIQQIGQPGRMWTTIAVGLSSIIFGLVHYEWGPMGMVQTFFMGLALGICFIKLQKKLWILILAHAYMDTILMVQMYLASR